MTRFTSPISVVLLALTVFAQACQGLDMLSNLSEPDVGPRCHDGDNDGVCPPLDCNDNNANQSPLLSERCDQMDNDCDGYSDEAYSVGVQCIAFIGTLCERPGVYHCTANGDEQCVPQNQEGDVAPSASEECNNVDDDCDGAVDEGNPGGSDQECSTGLSGICNRGHFQCIEGGISCEPEVLVATVPEVCDNLDNDCDGAIDEDLERDCYYGPAQTQDRGVCVAGTQQCFGGQWSLCLGMVTPTVEVCDGLDNDCDQVIDDVEGGNCLCNPPAAQACYGGGPETLDPMGVPRLPCAVGTQACGADGRWEACGGSHVVPAPEQCNLVDDDCDGTTDEDAPGAGVSCSLGLGVCRREGVLVCDARA